VTVEAVLTGLQELQSTGDSIYPKGVFPSQRYHPFLPYKREDGNLFFTCSVVKILQGIEGGLTKTERGITDAIISDALNAYPIFRNKNGLDTYNFWQTKPSHHFPNGMFMHRFKHFQIPDDIDDTALVFITKKEAKERVQWLRNKLKSHSNLAYKKAFNPLVKYQNTKCYSTFFGEKMYIEFDVCVLSNLMSLILTHIPENELDEYDSDTLEYICSVIENDEHLSLPFYSAPNYPTTDLILYHVGRLIPLLPKTERFQQLEEKVKFQIFRRISFSQGLNRIMLENAYLKFGENLPPETNSGMAIEGGFGLPPMSMNHAELLEDTEFFFFHAGMITAFENSTAQKLASCPLFHLRYTSKALNRALLIENMLLKRSLT
jgi:hypothetical protein